jgi:ferredoxin
MPAECTVSPPGDKERIAALLGIDVGEAEGRVARLACAGGSNVAQLRAHYIGEQSCAAAAQTSGGGKGCTWGCLGYGDCVSSCEFDAIELDNHGLPVVDQAACVACGDCVAACPRDLFSLESIEPGPWVACRNPQAGNELLDDCQAACTACGKCAADAPDAIVMKDNLPVVMPDRSVFRMAIDRCPTGAIVWIDASGLSHRGREAPAVRQGDRRAGAT